jgi:hypothetical protein
MRSVRLQLGNLLIADPTTLAPPTLANKVSLVGAPFALTENLTVAGLTLLNQNGLVALSGVAGSQEVALDPTTQQQTITLNPPAGGWRWVSSGTFTAAVTVYGWALTDNAGANLLAAQTLPTPVVINAAGYQVDLDPITIILTLQPMS